MKKQLIIAALAFGLSAGMAGAQVGAVIRIGPPPHPREVIPPRPIGHRDWIWQPGYHRWDGRAYVWVPGTYAAPPRPHARWVPGHWAHRRGGYVWIDGHWR
jgi:hypothetical protein